MPRTRRSARAAVVLVVAMLVATAALGTGPGLATAAEAAPTCDRPARVVRNRAYVDAPVAERQRLDLYLPERTTCEPVPVVGWVHGGGWRRGDKRSVDDKAAFVNGLGYAFASINYRLSDGSTEAALHPDHADDVGAAIAWLQERADRVGIDPDRIALLGHSAGAHLVALVGLDPRYVERAGGDIDGVLCVISNDTESYDLVVRAAGGRLVARLVENAFGPDPAVLRDASPMTHVDDRTPPPAMLVVSRGLPTRAAVQHAFADAVRATGADVRVVDAPGYSHGDVNRRLGSSDETVVTPPVRQFLTDCLG